MVNININKGLKKYKEAKKIILGGNMLLSKRPEMFLPNRWPSYFKKSKGIVVEDLDNNKYIDMICAVGTNILGYANPIVDNEVIKAIKKGIMSTLNSYEEVELTKKLLNLHKWADMAKYCRSGGEANALAIRIARSAARNDKVAICGYHGWHDWYLAANFKKNKLGNHLLPGLKTIGVNKNLKNTAFTFNYNNIDELLKLIKEKNIGVVKMEVARNNLPNQNFLSEVRKVCNKYKIILIFDECTTGFRRCNGGMHLLTGIEPDILMLGKALGNGYAITAVIGKKNIMMKAQESFISSTFWTERIGFVAANKTLEVFKQKKPWEKISRYGRYINDQWTKIARENNLPIKISGYESITSFSFQNKLNQYFKTYITQEMLKKKYLASNQIYLNIFHDKKVIDNYIKSLNDIFQNLKKIKSKKEILKKLNSPVSHSSFQRLND
jgi:glutamate-1-semialdehyde 2,1-aminomutase